MIAAIGNQPNKVTFGQKVPTKDVIQMITGQYLTPTNLNGWKDSYFRVTDAMTGNKRILHTALARQCGDALIKKFPKLKDVMLDSKKFFRRAPKKAQEIDKWVNKQIEFLGSQEIDVPRMTPDCEKLVKAMKKDARLKGGNYANYSDYEWIINQNKLELPS